MNFHIRKKPEVVFTGNRIWSCMKINSIIDLLTTATALVTPFSGEYTPHSGTWLKRCNRL